MTVENKADLEGIGGWLALLAFAQVIGVVRLVLGSLQELQESGPLAEVSGGIVAIIGETALSLGMIALALATTFALFMKKKVFLTLFFYQWIAIPVIFILDFIIVAAAMGVPMAYLTDTIDPKIVSNFLATGIWVWYTRKSKRVANTMVN